MVDLVNSVEGWGKSFTKTIFCNIRNLQNKKDRFVYDLGCKKLCNFVFVKSNGEANNFSMVGTYFDYQFLLFTKLSFLNLKTYNSPILKRKNS